MDVKEDGDSRPALKSDQISGVFSLNETRIHNMNFTTCRKDSNPETDNTNSPGERSLRSPIMSPYAHIASGKHCGVCRSFREHSKVRWEKPNGTKDAAEGGETVLNTAAECLCPFESCQSGSDRNTAQHNNRAAHQLFSTHTLHKDAARLLK